MGDVVHVNFAQRERDWKQQSCDRCENRWRKVELKEPGLDFCHPGKVCSHYSPPLNKTVQQANKRAIEEFFFALKQAEAEKNKQKVEEHLDRPRR